MSVLVVNSIPLEFTTEPRFVVVKYGPIDLKTGKPKKEPWRIDLTRRAASTKPRDWGSFHDAVAAVEAGTADLIGYALPEKVFTLVDLDDVVNGAGELHPAADEILTALGSYSEWSQSGVGVHVLVRGRLSGGHCQTKKTPWGGEFAVWDHDRFVYLTGELVEDTPAAIEDRQAELDELCERYFAHLRRVRPERTSAPRPVGVDDRELLDVAFRSRRGAEIEALWRGDTSAHNGDDSAADYALCRALAFFTAKDAARMDALFRASGLYRQKWERADYRERTIEKAIAATSDVYTPPRARPASAEPQAEPDSADDARPYALPIDEFIAAKSDLPAALLGDAVETILAALGLVILFGRGGRGKTTLTVEAALHLASGIAWLGFAVGRPLRILLIENEGPRELFREKLERKLASWPHELAGAIFVYTESWGAFTLAADDAGEAIARLHAFIADNRIDLVIGDPLDTLGVAGVGSPEQTRDFVALMVAAGLGRDVAFWLLHHPRKERADDELDELAGAWGGKPDTVMRLDVQPGDRARLSFPKIRWRRRSLRPALILAFDPETEGYSVVGEEGEERDLAAEIEELLADGEWRTAKEIAAKKDAERPGIGADVRAVKRELEEHPDRFESRTGEEALELGRRRDAVLWQKRSWASNTDNSDPASQGANERSGVRCEVSIGHRTQLRSFRPARSGVGDEFRSADDEAPDEVITWAESEAAAVELRRRTGEYAHSIEDVIAEARRMRERGEP